MYCARCTVRHMSSFRLLSKQQPFTIDHSAYERSPSRWATRLNTCCHVLFRNTDAAVNGHTLGMMPPYENSMQR